MARQILHRMIVFGIDDKVNSGQITLDEIEYVRRSTHCVLVKIEPQFVSPTLCRWMIRDHPQDCLARRKSLLFSFSAYFYCRFSDQNEPPRRVRAPPNLLLAQAS